MIAYLLTLYALLHLCLFADTFRWAERRAWPLAWLRAMSLAMAYDNLVSALGPWAVGSSWVETINVPRYVLHAALLPFMPLYALNVAQRCGLALAQRRGLIALCWLFTVAALAYGITSDVVDLTLVSRERLGHVMLAKPEGSPPPHATIAANVGLLLLAFHLWRATRWPWLFLGALFILSVNGAFAAMPWGFVAGNAAEVFFSLAMLRTERALLRGGALATARDRAHAAQPDPSAG
jgi:hypothetical protein